MKFHEIANLWPVMDSEELKTLTQSIREFGQFDPIDLFDGKVLDGRNRWKACKAAKVEPKTRVFKGTDPVAYTLAKNGARRDLTSSQRAMVAARLATLKQGRPSNVNAQICALNQDAAAAQLHVSRRSVQSARKVLAHGDAGLIAAVDTNQMSVSDAASDIRKIEIAEKRKKADKEKEEKRKLAQKKVAEQAKEDAAEEPETKSDKTAKTEAVAAPERVEVPDYYTLAEWKNISEPEREFALSAIGSSGFNKQDNAAIEWAQWSWNPVTGCKHNCPYCYARDIAERFYPQKFMPSIHPKRLSAPANMKLPKRATNDVAYRNVFTCSMADLFGRWVPSEWIQAVLDQVAASPKWNFLFLTKFPKRYAEFVFPANAWIGTTVDCQARVNAAEEAFAKVDASVKWLSVEPMIEPLKFKHLDRFDWIVIGGASASTKTPEWRVPIEWWLPLHQEAVSLGIEVYHKDNLFRRTRSYPGFKEPMITESHSSFHYLSGKTKAEIIVGEN